MALREINLVPPDAMAVRTMKRHLVLWGACLVLLAAVISSACLLERYLVEMQLKALGTKKELAGQLTAKSEVLKNLQLDDTRVNEQVAAITSLKVRTAPVPLVISKLSEMLNDETWVSQLSLEAEKGSSTGTRLTVIGVSASNDYLGDFLSKLSREALFGAVELKYANESEGEEPGGKGGKGRSIRFQISCQVRNG